MIYSPESRGQAADPQISWETGIHRSSVSRIICKDLHLKCFKRRHSQELTDANCAVRMKRAKLLLAVPQYATDLAFFTDKKVFSVISPDSRQNKQSQWQTAGTSEEEA